MQPLSAPFFLHLKQERVCLGHLQSPLQFSPPWWFSSQVIMRRGAAPKEVSKRDLVKPSPVRVQLWGVSERSRKATPAVSSPTRGTILNKGKTGPWPDRASHCLAPGCTRNDDCLRIQGTISMCAQQERTNHYTLASSATEPCTDNNHLPCSIFSLGGTKEEYSAFLTASL